MIATIFCLQGALAVAATTTAGPRLGQRVASGAFVVAGAVVPWFAPDEPIIRMMLSATALLAFIQATEMATVSDGLPLHRRLVQLVSLVHDGKATNSTVTLDWSLVFQSLALAGLFVVLLFALAQVDRTSGVPYAALRLALGLILVYALMELLSSVTRLGHRLFGIDAPAIQRAPYLARSGREFWGMRWNRFISDWLRRFVFCPLARRHRPVLGLFSAFLVSGALHAWLCVVPLGVRSAAMIGSYFVVEGALVVVEGHLRPELWPVSVARLWTWLIVLVPSPLFIDPALRTLGL
jgi:hypothetical protein